MKLAKLLQPLVVSAVASACAAGGPVPDADAVRAALDSMHVEHVSAYLAEDVDAVMEIYTDEPVIRSNHVEPLRGRAAVREFISRFFTAFDVQKLEYGIDELAVHGDSAYAIGTVEATVRTADGALVEDRGSYMVLYVRDPSGAWRSHRGVFNSSVPLTPLPEPLDQGGA